MHKRCCSIVQTKHILVGMILYIFTLHLFRATINFIAQLIYTYTPIEEEIKVFVGSNLVLAIFLSLDTRRW